MITASTRGLLIANITIAEIFCITTLDICVFAPSLEWPGCRGHDTMFAARAICDGVIVSQECETLYSSCNFPSTSYDHCGFGIAVL
jgi:hypothetical protein